VTESKSEEQLVATIVGKFDLGYLLALEDGFEYQLRAIEQRGRELEHHLASSEDLLYGQTVRVYRLLADHSLRILSQFSPSERQARREEAALREGRKR